MREEYFILIKMVKMKNCRHLWPRHDIPLSKAWRGERPRPPVPQLALPPAAIIGARRSSPPQPRPQLSGGRHFFKVCRGDRSAISHGGTGAAPGEPRHYKLRGAAHIQTE